MNASALVALIAIVATTSTFSCETSNSVIDDSRSEVAIGLSDGGELAAIQAFDTIAGQEEITAISMAFGTPGLSVSPGLIGGETLKVYLWSDTDGDGDPSNGGFSLLNTTVTTVNEESINTDILQSVAIPPTVVPATGFFIGYAVTHPSGECPLSLDVSQPSLGRAWGAGDTGGSWDPVAMAGDVSLIDMDSTAWPGVWLLRAGAPCPWDCEPVPNGLVDIADMFTLFDHSFTLFDHSFTTGPCDFDGNGLGDIDDLFAMFSKWGPCP